MPPRPREQRIPNGNLRHHRLRRGWCQQDVADRLIRLGYETGERNLGVSAKTVSAWERGENIPRPPYLRLLCELFGVSAVDLGLCPPEPHYTGRATREARGDDDVERRMFLQLLAATGIGVTMGVPSRPAPADRRDRWNDTASQALLQPTLEDLDRRPSAETYLLVAWLTWDTGRLPVAMLAYDAAIRQAKRSGNSALMAYMVGHKAHFLTDVGDHRTALRYLSVAGRTLPHGRDYNAHQALLSSREGLAWAGLGDRDEALRALGQAERLMEDVDGDLPYPMVAVPRGEEWFAEYRGRVHLRLGDHRRAVEVLTEATGPSPTKRRAWVLADLAEAHRQAGDLDEAAHAGLEAVELGHRLGSREAVNRVRQVRGRFPTGRAPRSADDLDAALRPASP